MSRRRFIFTLGAGAAVFALNGYSVGAASNNNDAVGSQSVNSSSTPSLNTATDRAPKWSTVPTITFTEGVPAFISIAAYLSDADSVEIIKNSVALPAGVTYDASIKAIVYDGVGTVGFTDGHVLTVLEA